MTIELVTDGNQFFQKKGQIYSRITKSFVPRCQMSAQVPHGCTTNYKSLSDQYEAVLIPGIHMVKIGESKPIRCSRELETYIGGDLI